MAGEEDESEKPHEASQNKIDEARKKGEIARSADLNTAGSYGGLLLALLALGGPVSQTTGANLAVLLGQPHAFADLLFQGGHASAALGTVLTKVALAVSALFLLPAAVTLLTVIAQRAFVIAPSKLEPKLSRINPIENAKNKFGASGLFEFGKSIAKLSLYCILLGLFLSYRMSEMVGALHAEPAMIGVMIGQLIIEFLLVVLLITLAVGAADFTWQFFEHLRRQRMSHMELRDEFKQNYGDPAVKQQHRRRGMDIASRQMMAEVPGSDVVIVNPTHYAIALKWSRAPGAAPICVAKGVDHIALAIRDLAYESGVPVQQDPATARALHATTEIGQEIDPTYYAAVAVAIRYAEDMRRKARSFG